jgi:hypothetical protein
MNQPNPEKDWERIKRRIHGWHAGQLVVACITLVVAAIGLGMISGEAVTAFVFFFAAVFAGLRLIWIWFDAQKKPPP